MLNHLDPELAPSGLGDPKRIEQELLSKIFVNF